MIKSAVGRKNKKNKKTGLCSDNVVGGRDSIAEK
jgi:hypothetical protein